MENTNAVAKKQATLKDVLKSNAFKESVSAFFNDEGNRDRFLQAAIVAQAKVPRLAQCERNSFLGALMQLAQMGLNPDGRNAHLIPYKDKCTLVVDYKGFVTLAHRSPKVSKVEAFEVCENDHFRLVNGEVEHIVDNPFADRGATVGYYAVCQFKDGTKKYEVMSKPQIDVIRSRSKAAMDGPWVTDYDEMAKKVVFKRLSKWLPVTPQLLAAIEHDDEEYRHKDSSTDFGRGSRITASSILGEKEEAEVEVSVSESPLSE